MLIWINAFFKVLFEELEKLFKPKPTTMQLEVQRKLNIQKNLWNMLRVTSPKDTIIIETIPPKCCKVCQVIYRGCPMCPSIIPQRRELNYTADYCLAHQRIITQHFI